MKATIRSVNAAVRKAGIPLELVRGEGYHYWVHDEDGHYDTVSEMVCYTSHISVEKWVEWARIAMKEMQERNQ